MSIASSSRRARLPALFAATLAASLAALAGCGANPNPPDGYLWTLDDFVPAARTGGWPLANQIVSPAGTPIALLSDPYTPGADVLEDNATDGLNVFPAFSEGAPAAYAITEVWDEWPGPVWVQPLYFPITGFDSNGNVVFLEGANATPIFSVPTSSRFYSPYWQIYYFVVPSGTDADDYVTVKSILDAGFPLIKGALTFCALGPANVNLAHAQGSSAAEQPLTGTPIPLRNAKMGWVEGVQVSYIDFGRSRYLLEDGYSDPDLVEADALFQFAIRDPATGAPVPLPLPRVGGTGPLGEHRPPSIVQGRPQFGALWHEYQVLLNPAGGADTPAFFIPNSNSGLRALVVTEALGQTQFSPAPDASLDALDAATLGAYTLRLAANPTACFVQPNPDFPGGPCTWLDSQVAVESFFSSELIYDTERLSSCPLVMFNGAAVVP